MSFCSDVTFRKEKKSNVFSRLTLEMDKFDGFHWHFQEFHYLKSHDFFCDTALYSEDSC